MRRLTLQVFVAVLGLIVVAQSADAQRRRVRGGRAVVVSSAKRVGGHLGYNFDVDELLLGAQASLPITERVDLYPSFDWDFVDVGTLWNLNVDLKYTPPSPRGVWYVGLGWNLLHRSVNNVSNTNSSLNLLSGLEGRRGPIRPYVEAKATIGDNPFVQVVGGLSWVLR